MGGGPLVFYEDCRTFDTEFRHWAISDGEKGVGRRFWRSETTLAHWRILLETQTIHVTGLIGVV